jgi:hypothetical protein
MRPFRFLPIGGEGLCVFGEILDGTSMCKSIVESSNIWIVNFLVYLGFPLVDCGGSAVAGIRPQE